MEKDTQKTVIEIKDLMFSYDDGETDNTHLVLKGVDLCVKKGEFLAILGHNGSGKSTLAKHLNAIFVPKNGRVMVEGMDTADDSVLYDIRQKVGMVFQNPDNQLVATIVEEDVAFAPENLGIEPDEIRKRVDYALDAVNMTKFAQHAPHMLSGGQKQRIAIAGVLAMKPDILVMDEPTAMLDPVGRQEIMNTVKKLNQEENITVIMITHFMEEAALADRIVVMDHGEAVMEGTPKEIFSQVEKLKKIGLDVPQTTELLYSMKKSGFELRDDLLTIDECVNEIMSVFKAKGGVANGQDK